MAITGATYNFNKTVTEEEKPSTAAAPTDSSKLDTKMAGEKKGSLHAKDVINLSLVQQTLKSAINNSIQSIESAQLTEQASAVQSIASTTISSVFLAATNPYALVAVLACQGISYGFKTAKRARDLAWQNYDTMEYRTARGYSAASSRSRSS